jgi:hypothetical protein
MALLIRPKDEAAKGRGELAPADGLERFAWLMDHAFTIPGTKIRFGLDGLIGLLPFGGDALMGLLQAGLVGVALTRYNVPRAVAARMILNVLLDVGVGSIPILGDVFDVFFKANTRNVALLREARDHEEQGRRMPEAPSRRWLVGLAVGFLVVLALMVAGLVVLFLWAMKSLLGHPLI